MAFYTSALTLLALTVSHAVLAAASPPPAGGASVKLEAKMPEIFSISFDGSDQERNKTLTFTSGHLTHSVTAFVTANVNCRLKVERGNGEPQPALLLINDATKKLPYTISRNLDTLTSSANGFKETFNFTVTADDFNAATPGEYHDVLTITVEAAAGPPPVAPPALPPAAPSTPTQESGHGGQPFGSYYYHTRGVTPEKIYPQLTSTHGRGNQHGAQTPTPARTRQDGGTQRSQFSRLSSSQQPAPALMRQQRRKDGGSLPTQQAQQRPDDPNTFLMDDDRPEDAFYGAAPD